ncbi:MAG: hypothetical protein IJ899_03885 [Blautia sp.]|nr:hypothetical protein [Blautia sp.]
MNNEKIISNMNTFIFRLNEQLGKWLAEKLPKITENWWQELVLDNLSTLQKDTFQNNDILDLKGLDLAALLRVVDRNWFVITI